MSKPASLTNGTWQDLVDQNEREEVALSLAQRNALWDAAQYIKELERDNLAALLTTTTRERDALLAVCDQVAYIVKASRRPPSETYATILELVLPALMLVKAGRE